MKTSLHVLQRHSMPLTISAWVALSLAGCEQKSASVDPAKERQMQEMQAKLDALGAQSAELNRQLADRDAAALEEKRASLEKDQANVEQQRAQIEADRKALAAATPNLPAAQNDSSEDSSDEPEPVYQGKTAGYGLFYSKLEEDGNWIDSDEYGYIWHPRVAQGNPRWRPYSDGRWVDTDRGWTWESRERFGWATYHYGRWVNLRESGWCWVPGEEWAPAWVSWRSSDRYVGWAPLPPEARIQRGASIDAAVDDSYGTGPGYYNFVDTGDFGEETYVGRIVAPEQNLTIINETVNVTNITYNNRGVHSYGPDYDNIRRHSRRPVSRYQLDLDRNPEFDRDSTAPRPRGDRLAVVAPILVASGRGGTSEVRPVKVEKKIVRADRDDGWRGVDAEERRTLKEKERKQAERQAQEQQARRNEQRKAEQVRRTEARAKLNAQRSPENPPVRSTPAVAEPRRTPGVDREKNASTDASRERRQTRDSDQSRTQEMQKQADRHKDRTREGAAQAAREIGRSAAEVEKTPLTVPATPVALENTVPAVVETPIPTPDAAQQAERQREKAEREKAERERTERQKAERQKQESEQRKAAREKEGRERERADQQVQRQREALRRQSDAVQQQTEAARAARQPVQEPTVPKQPAVRPAGEPSRPRRPESEAAPEPRKQSGRKNAQPNPTPGD